MDKNNHAKKLPGFYIALCCCVIAIGAAGFIAQRMETKTATAPTTAEETDAPQTERPIITQYPDSADSARNNIIVEAPKAEPPAEIEPAEDAHAPEYTLDNPDTQAAVVAAARAEEFISPVPDAPVLEGFSGETLQYNSAYNDWRAHNGIDIEAAEGTSVNAAADGTVCEIKEGSYGKQITLQHNNGYSTVYAQLGDINVSEGDEVAVGSAIATIGKPLGENVAAAHLHYELRRDGNPLNPEDFKSEGF